MKPAAAALLEETLHSLQGSTDQSLSGTSQTEAAAKDLTGGSGTKGADDNPKGSIAYAALHKRTEAFLKASRTYQAAVKGPLMDATDVYLQQKAGVC
eukprot:g27944.t1